MAITLVQSKLFGATNISTSFSPTLNSATTVGNALILLVGANTGAAWVTGVTGGGTWATSVIVQLAGFQLGDAEIWFLPNITSAVTSVTASVNTNGIDAGAALLEVSGLATSSYTDVTATGTATSTTITLPSVTTLNANDFVVGIASTHNQSTDSTSFTTPGGFTDLTKIGYGEFSQAAYQIVTTTGSYSCSWTDSTLSAAYSAVMASFKAAGAASPVLPPLLGRHLDLTQQPLEGTLLTRL